MQVVYQDKMADGTWGEPSEPWEVDSLLIAGAEEVAQYHHSELAYFVVEHRDTPDCTLSSSLIYSYIKELPEYVCGVVYAAGRPIRKISVVPEVVHTEPRDDVHYDMGRGSDYGPRD